MSPVGFGTKIVSQNDSSINILKKTQVKSLDKSTTKDIPNVIVTKDKNNINPPKASAKPMEKVNLADEEERDELTKAKDELGNKVIEDVSGKVTGEITEKVAARAGVKIATKSSSKFVEKASITLAKVEKNATGRVVTGTLQSLAKGVDNAMEKGINKVAGKGINKLAVGISTKIGVKAATKIASTAPFLGTALGVYCTKEDIDDFKSKINNKNVSRTSKALSGATVALDIISTGGSLVAATATVKGGFKVALVAEGVNLAATGASIITSGLSEYYKKK